MYNQDVIDRLNNLTNLYALKNANVKVISKKNQFGDVVKFFAQINTENIIQRITYKASGCTTFMALCSYFCEIVEGKSVEKALKINESDLKKFSKLEESKTHVYAIILDTFALLIKKYNVGVKKGKIVPLEPMKNVEEPKKIKKSKTKDIDIKKIVDINDDYLMDTSKKRVKKEKTNAKKEVATPINENQTIDSPKSKNKNEVIATVDSKKNDVKVESKGKKTKKEINNVSVEHSSKETKITKKTTTLQKNQVEVKETNVTKTEVSNVDVAISVESEPHLVDNANQSINTNDNMKKSMEIGRILERSTQIAQLQSDKEKQKTQANNMKLSHINALNDKIKNKETNEKMKNNSDNLNNLLNKFKMTSASTTSKSATQVKSIENDTQIEEKIVEDNKTTKKDKKENAKNNKVSKKELKEEKKNESKKKSLFSWFKK